MFLSIAIDFKIPIIFTKDEEDTAKFLILNREKIRKNETSIFHQRKENTKNHRRTETIYS